MLMINGLRAITVTAAYALYGFATWDYITVGEGLAAFSATFLALNLHEFAEALMIKWFNRETRRA